MLIETPWEIYNFVLVSPQAFQLVRQMTMQILIKIKSPLWVFFAQQKHDRKKRKWKDAPNLLNSTLNVNCTFKCTSMHVQSSQCVYREVPEVCLKQFGDIITEKNLKLWIQLVWPREPSFAQRLFLEDWGSGFSDEPGSCIFPRNHPHTQGEETVAVEKVKSLSWNK